MCGQSALDVVRVAALAIGAGSRTRLRLRTYQQIARRPVHTRAANAPISSGNLLPLRLTWPASDNAKPETRK
jgi:hypothetical protein